MQQPPDEQKREPALEPESPAWEPPPLPPDDAVALPEPVYTPFSLTVGDGFKFGCGFTMALAIAALILLLILSLFFLAASLVGVRLPGT
jgi:hypothetical protein